MKIEVRNVKYAEFASEETMCFEATVYVDGKRIGRASNDGRGGCNRYEPYTVRTHLDAYAKTLPPETTEFSDPHDSSKPFVFQPDADFVVNALVDAALAERELRSRMKSCVVFTRDGKVYETKRVKAEQLSVWMAKGASWLKEQLKADEILNLMPFDEALATYRKR